MHQQLVQALIDTGVITGTCIAIDSCPIVVQLRENNLKTSMANRFDKTRRPAGDADAGLGIMIHYPTRYKKQVHYFWGYRNHVLNDTNTELPFWEATKPAHIHEIRIAKALIREAQRCLNLNIAVVAGDANYDVEVLLKYIVEELKAIPVIPKNPRNQQLNYQLKGDKVICEAGLPMYRKGKMRPRSGILYCQYICPILYDKRIRQQYITCPVFHPKFQNGKGCNKLIRLEPSIRAEIDYGTEKFKELYNARTSVERVFSRLLTIAMQNPTVRGYYAIRNHVTIAHITVLLVALTAHKTKQRDKIRFVKSFVPYFLR